MLHAIHKASSAMHRASFLCLGTQYIINSIPINSELRRKEALVSVQLIVNQKREGEKWAGKERTEVG